MEKDHIAALKRAVAAAGGTQAALASKIREFGATTGKKQFSAVGQQTISYWLVNEVMLGPEWWPAIEFATDNVVTRRHLRPDVFAETHAA